MRYVIIPSCGYDQFIKFRDEIDAKKPFSVFRADYSTVLDQAVFGFWDSDYIPRSMEKYVVKPK